MKNYEIAVSAQYGTTTAYREHEQKTKNFTKEKWAEANDGLMDVFAEFAVCKDHGASADPAVAQALVARLQVHIIANYYTCTDEIPQGLARCTLLTSDSRKTSTNTARELRSLPPRL